MMDIGKLDGTAPSSPRKYSPVCVDRRMRSSKVDCKSAFASREQLCCEPGEGGGKCQDGISSPGC